VNKKCTDGQAITVHYGARVYMLDTLGYRHTLRMCKSYFFSTVTTVTRTRLNVTLYGHSVSS